MCCDRWQQTNPSVSSDYRSRDKSHCATKSYNETCGQRIHISHLVFKDAGGCAKLMRANSKTKGPASRGRLPGRKHYPVALPLTPHATCDQSRFQSICGQIGRNRCKHLGNSRPTYTSRLCVYPSMRWTQDLNLGMLGARKNSGKAKDDCYSHNECQSRTGHRRCTSQHRAFLQAISR